MIKVKITYKEDYFGEEDFECADTPNVDNWITVYQVDGRRTYIPNDNVKKVECWFE